jgi:hypothetical protein
MTATRSPMLTFPTRMLCSAIAAIVDSEAV